MTNTEEQRPLFGQAHHIFVKSTPRKSSETPPSVEGHVVARPMHVGGLTPSFIVAKRMPIAAPRMSGQRHGNIPHGVDDPHNRIDTGVTWKRGVLGQFGLGHGRTSCGLISTSTSAFHRSQPLNLQQTIFDPGGGLWDLDIPLTAGCYHRAWSREGRDDAGHPIAGTDCVGMTCACSQEESISEHDWAEQIPGHSGACRIGEPLLDACGLTLTPARISSDGIVKLWQLIPLETSDQAGF
ncbi:hypothetical protein QBC35DRAFT_547695 [Podospora australis]|uniref:Uncharacterized protein n=1 Tax=Podospora australis TaxID=1536484 RepID=A0AAN7AHQ5_9PEZI|nr:hypothetical protein QBC35DRAFT_547695 [Podospora australis]